MSSILKTQGNICELNYNRIGCIANLSDRVPIGFVHDQVRDATEIRVARLEVVDQSTGRGDDNLAAVLEVADLGVLFH
jgi:hypothetical protein